MRYRQPFDKTDPDASYQNANPALGLRGSILDIIAVEAMQREIIECIDRAGLESADDDWSQLWQATRQIYGVDIGSANALVIALEAPPPLLMPGLTVKVKKIGTANDGSCTLDIGLGTNTVIKIDGSEMADGELCASGVFTFVWDGAFWQVQNSAGSASGPGPIISGEGGGSIFLLNLPYAEDSSGVANIIDVDFSPAITSLSAGTTIEVKLANSITGATTILVNGISSKNVTATDGSALRENAGVVGQVLLLIYDGVKFQLVNPNPTAASFVPGVIYIWSNETAPAYTFECAGQSLSRVTYARLFNIIGTIYGSDDGATFKVPDLRGEFVRGWDHGRGIDPNAATRTNAGAGVTGDHVGTKQLGAAGPISITGAGITLTGVGGTNIFGSGSSVLGTYQSSFPTGGDGGQQAQQGNVALASISGTANIAGNSGATETRPRNVNMMYIIGY